MQTSIVVSPNASWFQEKSEGNERKIEAMLQEDFMRNGCSRVRTQSQIVPFAGPGTPSTPSPPFLEPSSSPALPTASSNTNDVLHDTRPQRPCAMQTAVQQFMPPLPSQFTHRPQYPHPSLNGAVTRTANSYLSMPTPPIASSSTSRKRKRNHQQYSVSYSEIQEVDHEGRLREVIVIEDTPPPPATVSPALTASTTTGAYSMSHQPPLHGPIRTRARAAAEAQHHLLSSASTSSLAVPVAKKRKREPEPDVAVSSAKRPQAGKHINGANGLPPLTKSWASGSGAATEDVRNHSFSLTSSSSVSGFQRASFL